jgi:hypothetical protein
MNFKISDFNISGESIPEEVADKILKWHIIPMQIVRDLLGYAMWASQKSGYRSVSWELKQGRSGNSQHTFKEKGAVDWTCRDFANKKNEYLQMIIEHTDYTRIAVYNTFIHCDYKHTTSQQRELYESDSNSKWKLIKYI